MNVGSGESGLKARLADELWRYLLVSAYLFVCFSVILMYESSRPDLTTAVPLSFALALGKALVLGKFILIGEALHAGERLGATNLLQRIAWRTLGMLLVLVVLKLIEEAIVGLVHGAKVQALLGELLGQSLLGLLAPVLLMMLILVPLITVTELVTALGGHVVKDLLLGKGGQPFRNADAPES